MLRECEVQLKSLGKQEQRDLESQMFYQTFSALSKHLQTRLKHSDYIVAVALQTPPCEPFKFRAVTEEVTF